MFTKAIVRTPSASMINGITSAGLGTPNFELALKQHQKYIKALEACGLEVIVLPPLEDFPDSCFVEDVALLTKKCAVITRPGAFSRREETKYMQAPIEIFFKNIEFIKLPGSLDAGDVMQVGSRFYIGISKRTNPGGANQLQKILEKHGLRATQIRLKDVLHLKTGVAYLENNNLLACGEFISAPELKDFNIITIPENEAYAANSIWVNDTVLMPSGFPKSKILVQAAGYEVLTVDASEFEKLDGGLSCLSLRF